MIKEPYIFTSILGDLMVGYIEEQRAVGYKYTKGASLLKKLDQLILENNLKSKELPKELVYQWTAKRPNETESTQNGRISTVRGFAKYMVRLGYDAYIYPPRALTIERYSYIPYIFSKQEIKKIFDICDNYPTSVYSPNRHLVISLILRMLYGCGLRISEAVNLKINDVNLTDGTLTIHNTKFDKSRIVPMSESLNKQCQLYVKEVHQFESKNSYFFPSPYGENYNESTIYKLFRKIIWKANISHSGKGPRLHDLRHTFAVHCLKKCVLAGENLTNLLPYLSAYLGHNDLRGTQHYLRLTSDLYPTITASVEQHFSNIIPEVGYYEDD